LDLDWEVWIQRTYRETNMCVIAMAMLGCHMGQNLMGYVNSVLGALVNDIKANNFCIENNVLYISKRSNTQIPRLFDHTWFLN
jgi:hypothetical protein